MKKKIIFILLIIVLAFIVFKSFMLYKYHANKNEVNTSVVFNKTININRKDNNSDIYTYINNTFDNYVDSNTSFKVKYDENNKVESFYSIDEVEQYINILNIKNMEFVKENTYNDFVTTDKLTKDYLSNHNIKNDIDLLKYIKDNYYFSNNIFTCFKTMKNNYLLNSFVDSTMPSYKEIILIDGDITGYIIDIESNKDIREIHILNNNKQYVIVLGGNQITSDDFITEFLSSINVD